MTNTRDLGPGTITIDGEVCETSTFEVGTDRYTIRELLIDETDEINTACKQPDGDFNVDLQTRLLLAKAIIDPETTPARVGKFTNRKYMIVLRAFNALNSISEANPTPAGGSPAPTSPSGGDASPETSDDSQPASTAAWSDSSPTT